MYEERNRVSMTGGSRSRRQIDRPSPEPVRRTVRHQKKGSSVAAAVMIGAIVAALLLCGAAALLARAEWSFPSLGLHAPASAAGVREERIQGVVQEYLLSSKNPMRDLNAGSEYRVTRSETDQGIVSLTVTVVQETAKTHYECDLQTKWKKDGLEHSLAYWSVLPGAVCYPRSSPGTDAERALTTWLRNRYPDARFQIDLSGWRRQDHSFTAGVQVAEPGVAYTEETSARITMDWHVPEEAWQADGQSFQVLERAVDFSALNGTWTGVYSHPSTYLRENDIPYTITFSNAGRMILDGAGAEEASVTVRHTLNELWDTYQTEQFNVHYESGGMRIRKTSYGYYMIEFEETNVEGIFEHPCKIKIYSDGVGFEDALVAKTVLLYR